MMTIDDSDGLDVTPFPIDFDALKKGDDIPVSLIEHISGTKYGTDAYSVAALQLRKQIESRLEEREEPLYVVIVSRLGVIHICTDEEATRVSYSRVEHASASLRRNTIRLIRVDTGNLSQAELADHDRRLRIASLMNSGLREGRKKAFATLAEERKQIGNDDASVQAVV